MFLIPFIFLFILYNIFIFNKKIFLYFNNCGVFFIFENISFKISIHLAYSFAKFTNIQKNFEVDYMGISNKIYK